MIEPTPENVRAARARSGITQTAAGDLVFAALRSWQAWESGFRPMPPGLFELFLIKTDPDYPFKRARRRNESSQSP